MKKNQLLTICFGLFLVFIGSTGLAQNRTVTGTVLDEKNMPVQGAAVSLKNSNINTITAAQGSFTISFPASFKVLVVSFVGYETKEITAGAGNIAPIALVPVVNDLNAVVVTALGLEAKKDKIGYSTARISSEQVERSGEAGLADAL